MVTTRNTLSPQSMTSRDAVRPCRLCVAGREDTMRSGAAPPSTHTHLGYRAHYQHMSSTFHEDACIGAYGWQCRRGIAGFLRIRKHRPGTVCSFGARRDKAARVGLWGCGYSNLKFLV